MHHVNYYAQTIKVFQIWLSLFYYIHTCC